MINHIVIVSVCVIMMTFFLITYTFHCTWVTSEAYSSPSIVLSARSHDGGRIIFDDFREAYWWLRQNTPEDAKVTNQILYLNILMLDVERNIQYLKQRTPSGDVLVGLWLSDHCYGEPDHHC